MIILRKGQLLAEVLIAVGISALALVGIIQATNKSVGNSGFARRQATATGYADKAIQLVKNMRQNGWGGILTAGTYCFNGTSVAGAGACSITSTEYTGSVAITDSASPIRKNIVVQIQWTDAGKTYSARKETVLYRY